MVRQSGPEVNSKAFFESVQSCSVLRELMLTKTYSRFPSLRKFHATRIISDKLQASVRSGKAKVKAKPPRPSQLKDKKATGWKRNEGKRSRNESLPASMELSSMLKRHNRTPQRQYAVRGESTRLWASFEETRLSRSLRRANPKGKLSTSTKWVAHPRTSENDTAGGLPFPSKLPLFIQLPRTARFG
jgi:hypothetical protein